MKLKCDFEIVDMGVESIAVPIGEKASSVHGVVKLNPSGKEIFELIRTETTEEEIVEALSLKYENDRDSLLNCVKTVVAILSSVDLL